MSKLAKIMLRDLLETIAIALLLVAIVVGVPVGIYKLSEWVCNYEIDWHATFGVFFVIPLTACLGIIWIRSMV